MTFPREDNLRRDLIKEIFQHTWYEPILRVLDSGEARYREIRAGLIETHGESPGDGYISRELRGLCDLGLVHKLEKSPHRHVYSLTVDGRWAIGVFDAAYRAKLSASVTGSDGHRSRGMDGQVDLPIDTTKPHPARRYNYWLGGKDNFEADRKSADELEALLPAIRIGAVENRGFLQRAVTFLAQSGVRQFLDIGTGLPTADNTHEVAQRIAPEARVVYVDNDPLVLSHARALLTSSDRGATAYIDADLNDPQSILGNSTLTSTLDLSRPVGLILVAVLHFVHGDAAANPIVEELLRALPAGSYLAATHATQDFLPQETKDQYWQMYREGRADMWPRGRDEFAGVFAGLQLLEPGVVQVNEWRPAAGAEVRPPEDIGMWCAVARKP